MLLPPPPFIGNWQRFLNTRGARLSVDEEWGPKTLAATEKYRASKGLPPDVEDVLDSAVRSFAEQDGFVPFLAARHATILWPKKRAEIDLLVIHDMEYPELPQGARWCAQFFAGESAPKASAHYAVDSTHIYQMVRDSDIAWHAPYGNRCGIGIEHCGYAKQTRAEWSDAYSDSELTISAKLTAQLAMLYDIPLVRLSPADLVKVKPARGFCGHKDLTDAFLHGVGHTDPGDNFPWDAYLERVKGFQLALRGV